MSVTHKAKRDRSNQAAQGPVSVTCNRSGTRVQHQPLGAGLRGTPHALKAAAVLRVCLFTEFGWGPLWMAAAIACHANWPTPQIQYQVCRGGIQHGSTLFLFTIHLAQVSYSIGRTVLLIVLILEQPGCAIGTLLHVGWPVSAMCGWLQGTT